MNTRLIARRLNNCRIVVEDTLTADALNPALRAGLLHSRSVLAEYVTMFELETINQEVTNDSSR